MNKTYQIYIEVDKKNIIDMETAHRHIEDIKEFISNLLGEDELSFDTDIFDNPA